MNKPQTAEATEAPAEGSGAARDGENVRESWESKPWRRAFIDALGTLGDVSSACSAVGVGRSTVYRDRQADEAFALAWADAVEKAADALELELRKAATVGWPTEKVTTKTKRREYVNEEGKLVVETDTDTTVTKGTERSVTAAIFLLNGLRPRKYRQSVQVEHGGSRDSGPVRVQVERERTPARLEEILEIAAEVGYAPSGSLPGIDPEPPSE